MNTPRLLTNAFFAVVCAVLVNTKSFAEPPNLSKLRETICTYHDSGEYEKELNAVIQKAHQDILKRAAANQTSKHPQKLALVLDIDETSISNYEKLIAHQFSNNKERLHQDNLLANSPSIKSMLKLYNDALNHQISVFFITGRPKSEYHATEKNLKFAGYDNWTGLFLRQDASSKQSVIDFKSGMRKQLTQQGYTIIASIGDQRSDLEGGYTEKTYKLPNPYYYIP